MSPPSVHGTDSAVPSSYHAVELLDIFWIFSVPKALYIKKPKLTHKEGAPCITHYMCTVQSHTVHKCMELPPRSDATPMRASKQLWYRATKDYWLLYWKFTFS
jgi:hypothetical protein